MVREDALVNTGFFPTGRDQVYEPQGEDKWLVGTSEVPLVSYYADEVIDVKLTGEAGDRIDVFSQ